MTQVMESPPSPQPGAPPTGPATHPLVERITRLRGRVRLVLGLFGIGVLVMAAVGGIFVLMLADYLVHIPTAVRVLLLIAWITGLGALAWRVLISPLMTRLTDQFLASRVENVNRELADELMSAVQFIHSGTYRTNALAARHVDAAAARTANIKFEEAIDFRQSAKALALAGVVVVIVAITAGMNPEFARIGFSRWFTANPLQWPRQTQVAFAWETTSGDAPRVVPIGEPLLIRAKVTKGGYANQRVYLTTWSDRHGAVEELMTFQPGMSGGGQYVYERTLEPNGEKTLSLRLAAGDDTDQDPVTIRLAPRPTIREMTASIAPPPYVKDVRDPTKPAPAVIADLMTQAARAVEGATISVRVRSSKPFGTDASGAPQIRLMDENKDEEIPLSATRKLLEPTLAELTFPATTSLQARLLMRDEDWFENRVGGTLGVEVVPDGLPSVIITEPRRMVERSPAAVVNVSIQATDDLGLDGLKFVAEKFDSKPGEPPLIELPLAWGDRTVDTASGNTTGRAQYTWELASLKLQPGARVTFYAMVQDNYEVNGKRHPWVKSPPLSLQIRSEAEIADASRRDLNEVKERIKSLKGQQEQTRNQTDAIQKAIAAAGLSTPQQKSQLAQLAQQESEQAATATAIQQRTDQIAQDLRENNLGEQDLGKLATAVAEGMRDVGQNNMPGAASSLNQAKDSAGNPEKQESQAKQQAQQAADAAATARKNQEQAIATMNKLIDQLGAAGDFEAVRQELQKIQDQQSQLDQQTRELATQTIGRQPENLPKAIRDKLNSIAGQQKDLSNKTSELLDKMQKAAGQLQQTDPAASESLTSAAKTGQENQVSPSQGSASSSISKNQMSDASSSQSQADRGLQQMMDELNKNDERQLEQLSRQLEDLIQQLQQLRDAEDVLNKDTVAAMRSAAKEVMTKLGDRQGQLQMNTIVVQKRAENTKKAEAAATDIGEASAHMSTAAGALYGLQQTSSLEPETRAVASLDSAIKKLQQEKNKVDNQVKDKDLAEFIKEYQAVEDGEKTVKTTSDNVEKRRQAAPDKQVDRMGMIELAKLASRQGTLAGNIKDLSADPKLKDFPVITWMNGQITDQMDTSRDRLKRSETGPALARAEQGAIDRIEDIVNALKEEKQRPSEFQQDQSGGGGGKKPPLVPPLAQLKLLKAMQNLVNAQTLDLNRSIEAATDSATKSDLQGQAAKLGKTQGEIKDVANKVIQQMQQ